MEFIIDVARVKTRWRIDNDMLANSFMVKHRHFLKKSKKSDININVNIVKKVKKYKFDVYFKTNTWVYGKDGEKNNLFYFDSKFPELPKTLVVIANDNKNVDYFTECPGFGLNSTYSGSLLHLFPNIFYSFILPKFCKGIMLHGCGVHTSEDTYIFVASTGGGKSTISKLAIEKNFKVLNDDRIILCKKGNKIVAYSTPWHGEVEVIYPYETVIQNIYLLKKGKENRIYELSKKEFFLNFRNKVFLIEVNSQITNFIIDIVNSLNGFVFEFKPTVAAWDYLLNHT